MKESMPGPVDTMAALIPHNEHLPDAHTMPDAPQNDNKHSVTRGDKCFFPLGHHPLICVSKQCSLCPIFLGKFLHLYPHTLVIEPDTSSKVPSTKGQ